MSNLLAVYLALAEFGRKRAERRAAQQAGQNTQQTADVAILEESTSAAGEVQSRERLAFAQV